MHSNIYDLISKKTHSKSDFYKILSKYIDGFGSNITFINPFSYRYFEDNPDKIDDFTNFFIDGSSLVFLHNLFHLNKVDRVSFDYSSIAGDVFKFCTDNDLNVAIIGGSEIEIKNACNNIVSEYPKLKINYRRNGFFNNKIEVEDIVFNVLKSDFIILGLGTPKQEDFSSYLHSIYPGKIIFTCGGFITQTAIKNDYYFPIVKKLGLRWLQRAIMHKHVRRRLLYDYPIFFYKYIKCKLS
ncbi:WecB/TagA/CpsF family glycosyltransferase [Vibrio cholerae]|uniref:WecB/TagA/CpsF family glycosyltransferase n=3 Tax=Vibrio cholerae TaxID=666 RepID=UPI00215B8709|nr:WecB/TagA/CpsF family glycosyltransferase [Vibrio cholerae]EKF9699381.1 WecB/TagA/CpsF family glycosyltransferase [Vibrio cholerae]MCR9398127.1 WecB/TagA/CpsF family glycosyltransferase [Vibrio cholerae]